MSTNPWDINFTPAGIDQAVVNAVTGAVNAGEQVVEQVLPPAVGPVVQDVTQATEGAITGAVGSVLPGIVPPSSPPPVAGGGGGGSGGFIPASNVTNLGQTMEQIIEAAVRGSAKSALSTLAPALEAELAKEFQSTVTNVVNRTTGGADTPATPNLEDFIHADARSRAFRTLLIGLFVAVLTGLGAAAGQLAGADWSTHNGQVAAATMAIGAVVSSLVAYVSRLFNEPQVTKPLTAQLPSKAGP